MASGTLEDLGRQAIGGDRDALDRLEADFEAAAGKPLPSARRPRRRPR